MQQTQKTSTSNVNQQLTLVLFIVGLLYWIISQVFLLISCELTTRNVFVQSAVFQFQTEFYICSANIVERCRSITDTVWLLQSVMHYEPVGALSFFPLPST